MSNEPNTATGKRKEPDSIFPFSSKKELQQFLNEYPEAKAIKQRIEGLIKNDAGQQLVKAKLSNGGIAMNGDVARIAKIYIALGFHYVTKGVVASRAMQIQKKLGLTYPVAKTNQTHLSLEADKEEDSVETSAKPASKKRKVQSDDKQNESCDGHQGPSDTASISGVTTNELLNDADESPTELHTDDMGLASKFASIIETGALQWDFNNDSIEEPPKKKNWGGRPKGTTGIKRNSKAEGKANIFNSKFLQELTTKAAQLCLVEFIKAKTENTKVPKGTFQKIITGVEKEANAPPNTINFKTVQVRVKRNNPTGKCNSRTPVLAQLEPDIVTYCVQLAKMGQSLKRDQVVTIAETMIKRMNMESEFLEMKRQRLWLDDNPDVQEEQPKLVGSKWHISFMNRHKASIVEKVGHLTHTGHHHLLRLGHYKAMYDRVYESMVQAGVAEKYQRPVLFDVVGKKVSNTEREFAYGLPTRYRITKPENILFVDLLGTRDTSPHGAGRREGNIYNHLDGQSFNLPTELDSNQGTEMNIMKFSVYCFSDGVGNAVLCAIILLSEKNINEIPHSIRAGIDVFRPLQSGNSDEELYARNCRPGQAMEGGPKGLAYNGKEIPCFVSTSKTGLLDGDVLLEICQFLDRLNLYDRSTGVKPFLLLDGYEAKFGLPFLDYVKDMNHEWVVSCGLHHKTHLLNVANALEFNESFKEEFVNAEQRLLDSRTHTKQYFFPSDIVPLVRHAWSRSFGQPNSCQKAITMRGWNPLNYALLLHPALNLKEQLSERNKKKTE